MVAEDSPVEVRVPWRTAIVMDTSSLLSWPRSRWLVALAAAAVYAAVAGLATDVIANPIASRVVPPTWWSYPVLALTAVPGGLITASYVRSPAQPAAQGRTAGGGLLSVLAIGCPACNKLVVLALGTSGALNIWAPLQPAIGIASIVLLGWALHVRLAGEASCPLPATPPPGEPQAPAGQA
jgi:hypothetical protein